MNKNTAHIIIGILDVAAVAACYYVFTQWQQIDQLINVNSESITVQNYLCLYTLMVAVPVTHVLALFQWQGTAKNWANRLLLSFFLLVLVGALSLDVYLKDKILNAGYHYCANRSAGMTFSEFKTYLRGDKQCSK
ncbi:MAG: hypothetical protein KAR13_03130 [Desulfobulbaceae bacterium]|nr:hypothetical protein [Desulfobulbaceae bacterium]